MRFSLKSLTAGERGGDAVQGLLTGAKPTAIAAALIPGFKADAIANLPEGFTMMHAEFGTDPKEAREAHGESVPRPVSTHASAEIELSWGPRGRWPSRGDGGASTSYLAPERPQRVRKNVRRRSSLSSSSVAAPASRVEPDEAPSVSGVVPFDDWLSPDARKELTMLICGAADLGQLKAVVEENLHSMDHIHASAAFVRAAKLSPATAAAEADRQRSQDLMDLIEALLLCVGDLDGRMSRMDQRQASNVLWALAVVLPELRAVERDARSGERERRPALSRAALCLAADLMAEMPRLWGSAAAAATSEDDRSVKAPVASPGSLAQVVWAAARLRLRPAGDGAWLRAFLAASAPPLRAGLFRPNELSSTLWALAEMRLWPGERWAAAAAAAIAAATSRAAECRVGDDSSSGGSVVDSVFGPQALANTSWAVTRLRLPLPAHVASSIKAQCLINLDKFSPRQLSSLMWALARTKGGSGNHGGAGPAESPPPPRPLPLPEAAREQQRRWLELSLDGLVPPYRPGSEAKEPGATLPQTEVAPSSSERRGSAGNSAGIDDGQPVHEANCNFAASATTPPPPVGTRQLLEACAVRVGEMLTLPESAADVVGSSEGLGLQAIANAAWALASVGYVPSAAWTRDLLSSADRSAAAEARRTSRASPASFCMLLSALSK